MVLPTTHLSALLLLVAGLICFGSWPNLLKLAGPRWRFELFYIDFTLGALLVAILAAFTFGSLGSDATFTDRMLVAGRMSQAWLVAAGFVFNIANMLLIAGFSLLGVSGAFPLAAGLVLLVDVILIGGAKSVWLLIAGVVLLLASAAANILANGMRELPEPAVPHEPAKRGRAPRRSRMKRSTKGLIVAGVAGLLMSPAYLLAAKGMEGELALGPYAGALMFAIGMLFSAAIFNFYFRNLPVEGPPIALGKYIRGTRLDHLAGIAAGAIFALAWLLVFLAMSAPPESALSVSEVAGVALSAPVLAVLWGLLAWKEFAAAPSRSRLFIWVSTGSLFAAVIALGLTR